jgi:hypothetical protein
MTQQQENRKTWLCVRLAASFFSNGATASTQSQRAPHHAAKIALRRSRLVVLSILTVHQTTHSHHYRITPITITIMSEEEKTAPVVAEEPKEEEAAATGEDAPVKEEESTATFEPVVRQVKSTQSLRADSSSL